MRAVLMLVPLLLLLLAASYVGFAGWNMAGGGQEMSWHGVLAMVLGIGLTLVVTALLVWLLILSNRRGYDQPPPEG